MGNKVDTNTAFDLFFQNSNDLLLIVNSNLRIVKINQCCYKIFGYEPKELIGTNVMDLVHPDDIEQATEQTKKLFLHDGETLGFKNKATHKDGSTKWLQWSTCVKNGMMYATGVDVTRQEEKMRNIENFRRQYVSNKESNIGLWELNVESRDFYGDEHVYEILGVPFKIKQRLRDLSYVLTPESKLIIETHLEKVIQSKLFEDFECDIIRQSDKQIRSISVSGNFIFDENFNVKSFFGTIQDITEQNEIMKSFSDLAHLQRTILDALEAVVLLISDGKMQWMNKSDFLGYTADDVRKIGINQILKDANAYDKIKADAYEHMQQGLTYANYFEAHKKDGSIAWLHITGKVLSDKNVILTMTDVTEQKKAELTILKSHTLLKDTQRAARVGCWETNNNGKSIWLDDVSCKMLDIEGDSEVVATDDILNFVDESDKNNVSKALESISEHTFLGISFKLKTRKGRTRHIYATGDIFVSTDGSQRLVGIIQDITKLQNLETELQDKRQRINAIYKTSPTAIGIISSYNIFDCNPEFYELTGYLPEELQDEGLLKLMSQSEIDRLQKISKESGANGTVYSFETEWNKKDGSTIDVLLSFSRLNISGNYTGSIITATDISELKHAQYVNNILFEAINQSSSEFVIYDKDWVVIYANNQVANVHNCLPSDFVGKTIHELESRSKQQVALYSKAIETGSVKGEYQAKIGNVVNWHLLNISPIYGNNGEIISYISVDEDITDRKNMEMELMKALSKAEQSDKIKEALLQNLSHEVRTPLNSISGFSELISTDDELTMETIKSYTNIINKSSAQLLGIINDMLVMSDIQLGKTAITKVEIDPNILLDRMFKIFQSQAENKNIGLIYDNPHMPTIIHTDETKLVQIITNIITNALKFTNKGHVIFGYSIIDSSIRFYVKDTGIGISEENQKMIFERFFQVNTNKANNFGTGLGLAISSSFAKMLGGKLTVESELGKGTTFFLTLPIGK